ncbi:MAG: hypothetical protein RIS36_2170 [Pseudomonadota bacterium]|jgi:hypothetical protein
MRALLRIDTHAHLYDSYSVKEWCEAAVRNLGGGGDCASVVFVVDREGQDSLARLRREVPSFGDWNDLWDGQAGIARLGDGSLVIVQGVQYVTSERLEVLGLGVQRSSPDGSSAAEYISRIGELGGLACLPWSPGKWLGSRGKVVRTLLDTTASRALIAGDISIRSQLGPPSYLLRYARSRGFKLLYGTDPLPTKSDEELVGSFGVELVVTRPVDEVVSAWSSLQDAILSAGTISQWGTRNSPLRAARRFLSSVL